MSITAVAIATRNALSATCWDKGMQAIYSIQLNMDGQDAARMPVEKSVAVKDYIKK